MARVARVPKANPWRTTSMNGARRAALTASRLDDDALVEAVVSLGPRWRSTLVDAGGEVRERPQPATWSAIEYAARTRDITALHVFGVSEALGRHEPRYPAIDGDALVEATATSYRDEAPALVAEQLDFEARRARGDRNRCRYRFLGVGITIGTNRITVRRLLDTRCMTRYTTSTT